MKNNSYYSGEDWIGSIPASWRLLRIGSLFKCRNVKVDDTEYPPLSVSKGGIVPQMDSVAKTDANDNRKQVLVGDFVINSRSDRKQSCGVSRLQGSVSLINTVLYPITDLIDSDYLDLLLKNYGFAEEFYRWGHGIVSDLWTTRWQEMSSIVIPVPPINRQKEIAIDVSSKKKAIESLLQNETKQIEKLNEYKASLITEAVTKGISGEPETKKSGVEWIGDIPASWSVIKLKYATYIRARLGWKGLKAEEYVPSGYPLLSAFNIINSKLDFSDVNFINKQRYDESPEIKLKNNDIILVKDGAGIGKCAIVESLPQESTTNGSLAVVSVLEKIDPKFLYYYFLSSIFQQFIDRLKAGMGVPHLFQADLREIKVVFPELEEQRKIVSFLDARCGVIDQLVFDKQKKIELMGDYKESLVYEYVTGKRENEQC